METDPTDVVIALLYALLVLLGATIAVPDPTMVLSLLVALVGFAVVGYALVDGSLRELSWGIALLYGVGIVVSILVSAVRESLLDTGLYGHALTASAILSVCALVGTYLTVRRRGAPSDVPLLS